MCTEKRYNLDFPNQPNINYNIDITLIQCDTIFTANNLSLQISQLIKWCLPIPPIQINWYYPSACLTHAYPKWHSTHALSFYMISSCIRQRVYRTLNFAYTLHKNFGQIAFAPNRTHQTKSTLEATDDGGRCRCGLDTCAAGLTIRLVDKERHMRFYSIWLIVS